MQNHTMIMFNDKKLIKADGFEQLTWLPNDAFASHHFLTCLFCCISIIVKTNFKWHTSRLFRKSSHGDFKWILNTHILVIASLTALDIVMNSFEPLRVSQTLAAINIYIFFNLEMLICIL